MKLSQLPKITSRKKKRLGRGYESGRGGHTVGKGQKGQKVRGKVKRGFEGGQLPLGKRLPHKRGFKSLREKSVVLNLSALKAFKSGSLVTPKSLVDKKILAKVPREGVKILGSGDLKVRLRVRGFALSKKALEKIKKAGGEVEG